MDNSYYRGRVPRSCMNNKVFLPAVRSVQDYPKKGINFKDISPILRDSALWKLAVSEMLRGWGKGTYDVIAGIESRGFIFASAMAIKRGCPLVMVRKYGKLPPPVIREKYSLEYGKSEVEIEKGIIRKGEGVLIVDDVLATGGTALATAKLIEKAGARVVGIQFFIELGYLSGIKKLDRYELNRVLVL